MEELVKTEEIQKAKELLDALKTHSTESPIVEDITEQLEEELLRAEEKLQSGDKKDMPSENKKPEENKELGDKEDTSQEKKENTKGKEDGEFKGHKNKN